MKSTELCLASSKILTPQPLSTQRICPYPVPKAGGYTTLAGKWGSGRSIFWKTPDIGLASYSIISLRYNLSNLGSPRQGLFSFHWTTEVVKYEVPCPPPPPIAASLILPAIFWGQPVRPYALNFFVFSFFYIVFWYFLFVILFLFFSPFYFFSFISSYPSLLILLILHVLFFVFLFFSSYIWICFLYYRHAGGKAFFDSFGAKVYTCATILFFCSYLFLFFSSDLFLFFSYYILLLLILVLQTCVLNTHLAKLNTWTAKLIIYRENPAKIPVWQKIRQSIPLLI